jgi:hypothetical protein
MPNLFNLLQIYPEAISDEECNIVINEFTEHDQKGESSYESSIHATTGLRVDSTFRAVSLLPGTAAFKIVHRCTQTVINRWIQYLDSMQKFNIKVFKQCLRYSHDYRVLKYEAGSSIHPHTDWDVFTFGSCTLALNDSYDGGTFSFFNGEQTIRLRKGSAMIWPADCFWVHEVTPVTSGSRYSVNSFINSIPENLKLQVVQSINELPKEVWQSPYRHNVSP